MISGCSAYLAAYGRVNLGWMGTIESSINTATLPSSFPSHHSQHNPTHPSRITRNNLKTVEPKMNSNNQRSRGGVSNDMADSSMNSTKDMMSGMDSGGGGKMDDNFGNNDRQNNGDNQGLMGKMASMVGVGNNNNDSNNNDRSGHNPSSKMMGGVGGGGGQQDFNRQRNNNQDQQPSMGDKVKVLMNKPKANHERPSYSSKR
ncbi:hypothetical protein H4Q26_005252 [Puccinia striiformis f. sp. tritici PST-130]|nr:hypothetical protein H4Q26_005252 [Puccinia striiformis f. sp. tritici PST-130]